MFSLLYSPVDTLLWLNFPVWVLVNPVFNWSISFLVCFAQQVNLLYFLLFGIFWLYLCVCKFVYMSHCFCNYLSDLVFTICQGLSFVSCSVVIFWLGMFVLIPCSPITNGWWSLDLLTRGQAWAIHLGVMRSGF